MPRRLPLVLVLAAALAAGLTFGACGVFPGEHSASDGGPDGGPGTADGGTPDGGLTDAGTPDAGTPDGGGLTDAGTPDAGSPWCGQVAPPDAPGLCCASCAPSQSGCQPNGCYGGWWCDTKACACVSPTAACSATDGGTPPPPPAPLSCTTDATYDHSESSGSCGVWRWPVKTGGDAAAQGVSLSNIQVTSVAHLASLTPPSQIAAGNATYLPRQSPTEDQVFELRDVHLSFDKLEDDSDYHLVVSDGSGTMIVEIPYPGCVSTSSPWACTITHARHDAEQYLHPTTSADYPSYTVSIIGVAFFDEIHGQTGVAANGIELHPVLRMCFGRGCDPLKAP